MTAHKKSLLERTTIPGADPEGGHRGHRIEINQKSDTLFCILISTEVRKTSAFVTGKCRFKAKSARGTCQDGVKMASKWCIGGIFSDMRIKKRNKFRTSG